MKNLKIKFLLFFLTLIFSSKAKIIAPGLNYQHIKKTIPQNLSIHVLTVDPNQSQIRLSTATNKCHGRKKLSEISTQQKETASTNESYFFNKKTC